MTQPADAEIEAVARALTQLRSSRSADDWITSKRQAWSLYAEDARAAIIALDEVRTGNNR